VDYVESLLKSLDVSPPDVEEVRRLVATILRGLQLI